MGVVVPITKDPTTGLDRNAQVGEYLGIAQGGTGNTTGDVSGLSVTATGGTVARANAVRFADALNAQDFYKATDAGFDAAIGRAIAAANARGGGQVLIPNLGSPLTITKPIAFATNVYVRGDGMPVLKLAVGANCSIFQSATFAANAAQTYGVGDYQCGLEDLWLDGNVSQQTVTSSAIDGVAGIAFRGFHPMFRNLRLVNMPGHGIRLQKGQSPPPISDHVEGTLRDISMQSLAGHGLWVDTLNDGDYSNIITLDASQLGSGLYNGFNFINCSGRARNLHSWCLAAESTTGYYDSHVPAKYACYSTGGMDFVSCHFESALQSVYTGGDKFTGCTFYNPLMSVPGTALVDVYGPAQGDGNYFGAASARANNANLDIFAIAIKAGAARYRFDGCAFGGFDTRGPINFVNDGGNGRINGMGTTFAASGVITTLTGTKAATTFVDVHLSGSANVDLSMAIPRNANGSISLDVADGTAAGGNARGAGAIDLQTQRSGSNQVVSGYRGFMLGAYNVVSSSLGVCFGNFNAVAGTYSVILGGNGASDRGITARQTWSGGQRSAQGDSIATFQTLHATTTDATSTILTTDRGTPTGANTMRTVTNTAMRLAITLVGSRPGTNDAVLYEITGVLFVVPSTASGAALVGTPTITKVQGTTNSSSWGTPTVTVNTGRPSVDVTVTGVAGATINWIAEVRGLEAG